MVKNAPRYAVDDDAIAKTMLRVVLYDSLNPRLINNKYKMSKETFDNILKDVKQNFNNNLIEPGEMVGVIAAESLGEAVTQMTISAFHHIGIASLSQGTSGVPRINELISASKNPKTPQMFIYLNDASKTSREMAHKIGSYLEKTTLGNIRGKIDVFYDPHPKAKGGIMEQDGITEPFYSKKLTRNTCQANVDNLPWMFRIEIDKEKMLAKEVTLMDIKAKFCMWWDRRHVNTKKKKEKVSILKKITSFAMLSNTDSDLKPIIHIRFNVKDLDKLDNKKTTTSSALRFNKKTLIDFIEMIDKFKLKGIEDIESITTIAKERFMDALDGDGMKVGEEQVIYTSGVNLKDIRYITGVNAYRSFSDDVTETFNTFGIEFARSRMLAEFLKAYDNAGNGGINPQHISLLVDIMCHGGTVISADRHGMKKANIDPLTKASFEKSVDVLISAAVFGDIDKMQGVSSRLYIGSVFKGGTGYCELVLDTKMIQNSEYIEKESRNLKNDVSIHTIANAIMDDNDNDNDGEDIFIP
jgi:DNA-directed RNA polymerase II subunit RPB1